MNVEALTIVPVAMLLAIGTIVLIGGLFAGLIPIPVGFDRGKIKWQTFCGTGAHWHTTYWWGSGHGFQSMHPADAENDEP